MALVPKRIGVKVITTFSILNMYLKNFLYKDVIGINTSTYTEVNAIF